MNNDNTQSAEPDAAHINVLDILSANVTHVLLKAEVDRADLPGEAIVVYVTRQMYHEVIDAYLDGKARYHAEFAGVCWAQVTGLTKRRVGVWLAVKPARYDDNDMPVYNGPKSINVDAYDASAFDIEFEHG